MTEAQKLTIRTHLLNGLHALSSDVEEEQTGFRLENCPDETDFATQLAQQGVNLAVTRRRMRRRIELEHALRRLRETDYGVCEECGEGIGLRRLMANPEARLCVSCQEDADAGFGRCA